MIQYIYFVKCPNCEDEHFDFFDEAKAFALSCLSKKPIITQIEVDRNDFGECTDHSDLGTVWSWEDECADCQNPAESTFTKDEIAGDYDPDTDPEFTDDDSDFRFINELEEGISNGVSFRNSEDFVEFKKLCDEIGIITVGDLDTFMKENDANDANILDKLREYRAELGPDFRIKESILKEGWEADVAEANRLLNMIITDSGNGNYDDGDSYWSGDDEWCNRYMYYSNSINNKNIVKELCAKYSTDICNFYIFEDDAEYDPVSEIGYTLVKAIRESRKPVPEGMTIEQLVEEMEENEEEVECTWCNELFPKDHCKKEVNLGYLCPRCADGIWARGEKLTFVEPNYWDFLDEAFDSRDPFDHHDPDYDEDEAADYMANQIDNVWDSRYDDALDSLDEARDPLDHHDPDYDEDEATDYIADKIDKARDERYDDAFNTF